jgi:hypothetical protein
VIVIVIAISIYIYDIYIYILKDKNPIYESSAHTNWGYWHTPLTSVFLVCGARELTRVDISSHFC